ncbi:DUF3800 domain-containing protein [Myxococcus landrumensis]|uniref:DUF3800 domain-containing protein n=1 Tax=Myxococcus landrumensis TaxID=2813577 RepID=A0ABX7NGF4_9BACT|nr:DUF3800 domain-containing protein [Myxococcus landrumus]QSQ17907.1 hypothetical protein JY572_18545 [Myxococcus landrumus]
MPTYEIFVDEAWTQGAASPAELKRYWCFYGGIFGTSSDVDRLDTQLRRVFAKFGVKKDEAKWSSLGPDNRQFYQELVDCLFDAIERGEVAFRQMFYDRAYVRIPSNSSEDAASPLDVQYKLCYQFLKHAFGLKFLPRSPHGQRNEILVRLDNHSSQKHQDRLAQFAQDLPRILDRPDLDVRLTYHRSSQVPRIQICDLMIGAAGSYGNKMHEKREPKQRGMKPKQRIRHDFAKYIYNRLRAIDAAQRGSKAFNWFETTGRGSDWSSLLRHKVRIWKFKPQHYQTDAGWHNDHLDKYGNYQGERLLPVATIPYFDEPAFTDED